ncbi:MAG TPA: hypothetical protein VEI97_04395, partial [bacterium]|nr:hypothetical protein [bacterium]
MLPFPISTLPGPATLEPLIAQGFADVPLAIVLGSGLALGDPFVAEARIPYAQIPGFPTTAVAGHRGTLARWSHPTHGTFLVMEGRPHLYEG